MQQIQRGSPQSSANAKAWIDERGEGEEETFKPLTAQEAQRWRAKNPPQSPWRVVGLQAMLSVLLALAAWGVTRQTQVAWSAFYGALAVVIPAALFARGLTGRLASVNPVTAVMGFFVWELVKVALTVAMLFAAPRLVVGLSWPAMLVSMMLTMQVYWLALVMTPKKR